MYSDAEIARDIRGGGWQAALRTWLAARQAAGGALLERLPLLESSCQAPTACLQSRNAPSLARAPSCTTQTLGTLDGDDLHIGWAQAAKQGPAGAGDRC